MSATKVDRLFDEERDAAPTEQGFRASMSGLNLFEFVQIECLTGANRAIRVTSGHHIGYLFFSGGAVSHALTPDAHGEQAARQILNWSTGDLEECGIEPPEHARVELPWQQVLLAAVQAKDEALRDNLVEFPRSKSVAKVAPVPSQPEGPPTARSVGALAVGAAPTVGRDGVLGAVRLSAAGEVISKRGDESELGGLAEYAMRLSELIGEAFGTTAVKSVDARMGETRCALKREASGGIVIVRALSQPLVSQRPSPPQPATSTGLAQLLGGLKDVDGVFGSVLFDSQGELLAVDLPQIFHEVLSSGVGARLVRMREAFETFGDRLVSLEIRFGQQRLYVRAWDEVLLGILNENAPLPVLTMAAQVVGRQALARVKGGPSAPAPSAAMGEQAPDSGGPASGAAQPAEPNSAVPGVLASDAVQPPSAPPRGMAAPGAPSPRTLRAARPMFFRGRRV